MMRSLLNSVLRFAGGPRRSTAEEKASGPGSPAAIWAAMLSRRWISSSAITAGASRARASSERQAARDCSRLNMVLVVGQSGPPNPRLGTAPVKNKATAEIRCGCGDQNSPYQPTGRGHLVGMKQRRNGPDDERRAKEQQRGGGDHATAGCAPRAD